MKILNTKEVMSELKLTQHEFAALIGIKQPSVSYRVNHNVAITAKEALLIEASHQLSKHVTRPDIFGDKAA